MAGGGVLDVAGMVDPAESAAAFAFAMVRATRELSVALDMPLDVRVGPVFAGVTATPSRCAMP